MTVRGYGLTEDADILLVTFTLSDTPDPAWIQCFRERAAYSTFDFTTAVVRRNLLRVELPERDELGSLLQTVERLVEAANHDRELQTHD